MGGFKDAMGGFEATDAMASSLRRRDNVGGEAGGDVSVYYPQNGYYSSKFRPALRPAYYYHYVIRVPY